MARKNLLADLMAEHTEGSPEAPSPTPPAKGTPRYQKGAIGAVSKSIAELKSRSVVEIDPHDISAGGLDDRLLVEDEDHASLVASIRTYGQQVPILVRPHPEKEGKFQIVYGRRRVLALRELEQPIKAMIRDLDDDALIMAQGQENNARKDLSFIEKANFARQMAEAGYERAAICDAINVDKTVISRMMQVTDAIPFELIIAIGPAHGVGRDRWLTLSQEWPKHPDLEPMDAQNRIMASGVSTSDERFRVVLGWLQKRGKTPPAPKKRNSEFVRTEDRARIAEIKRGPSAMTLKLRKKDAAGFDDWLVENLPELHRRWLREGGAQ